jgi:hypothetical protein
MVGKQGESVIEWKFIVKSIKFHYYLGAGPPKSILGPIALKQKGF